MLLIRCWKFFRMMTTLVMWSEKVAKMIRLTFLLCDFRANIPESEPLDCNSIFCCFYLILLFCNKFDSDIFTSTQTQTQKSLVNSNVVLLSGFEFYFSFTFAFVLQNTWLLLLLLLFSKVKTTLVNKQLL